MGVKNAVDLVLRTAIETKGPILTWGPLIHNPQVVEFLREQGVDVAGSADCLDERSTVVIRSHGVPPAAREIIRETGARLCDATCRKVANVQSIVKKYASNGHDVVLIGHSDHAEVIGLLGFAGERGYVVGEIADVEALPELKKPVVIGQTTLNRDWYFERANAVKIRFPDTKIIDTLCDSTSERQREIRELSKEVDAIVVVGGYNSSNTKRLYEVAESTGVKSVWVETEAELDPVDFESMATVAVTAGASTPHWIVSRVIERLEHMGRGRIPIWELPWIKDFGYAVIQSNILTGFAAAMLTASFLFLAGFPLDAPVIIAMGLFVFGYHTVYNLVDWQGFVLADPSKLRFFWGNRKILSVTAVLGLVVSTGLMWFHRPTGFILTIIGGILAGLFAIFKGSRIVPLGRRLVTWREIPGARDILHAVGWIFATGVVPFVANYRIIGPGAWFALVWIILISLLRSAIFSITDLESDRVLGRESIATVIGESNAWRIAFTTVILALLLLIACAILDILTIGSLLLIVFLVYMLVLIIRLRSVGIGRGTWAELAVDTGFVICGLLAIFSNTLF